MQLLVVDPGKTTGYGWLYVPGDLAEPPTFAGGEVDADTFVDWSFGWLSSPGNAVPTLRAVVCENFTVTERTLRERGQLWSTEQIGVLRHLCRRAMVPFVIQPTSAKAFGTDEKLKKLGWYAPAAKGEKGHRRDAARHALAWLVDNRRIDLRRLV